MSAFDAAATILAADLNLGSDALYTPAGEAQMALRLVLSREEGPTTAVGYGIVAAGWYAMIPVSSIPDRPQREELLSVGALNFTIETAELDETGASWRVTLRKA